MIELAGRAVEITTGGCFSHPVYMRRYPPGRRLRVVGCLACENAILPSYGRSLSRGLAGEPTDIFVVRKESTAGHGKGVRSMKKARLFVFCKQSFGRFISGSCLGRKNETGSKLTRTETSESFAHFSQKKHLKRLNFKVFWKPRSLAPSAEYSTT